MKDWVPKVIRFFKRVGNTIGLAAKPSKYDIHYLTSTPVTLTMNGKEYRLSDVSYKDKTYKAGIVAVGNDVYRFEYDLMYCCYSINGGNGFGLYTSTDDLLEAKSCLFNYLLEQSDIKLKALEEDVAK